MACFFGSDQSRTGYPVRRPMMRSMILPFTYNPDEFTKGDF
jgi:hypothetical protein